MEPPPVRGAVARPASAGAWWIQVGAYRSASAAGRVAAQVHGEILVVATPAETEPLLRVRVGPFADRARAEVRRSELEAQGWRAFLVQ
jgi:cell division septation protein DedD